MKRAILPFVMALLVTASASCTSRSTDTSTTPSGAATAPGWVLVAAGEGRGLPPPGVLAPDEYGQMSDFLTAIPGVTFDPEDQVLLMLSVPTGDGCGEEIRFDNLVINRSSGIVHGEYSKSAEDPDCVAILGSFRFAIAVDRGILPTEFTLQAEAELTHPRAVAVDIVLDG